MIKKMFAAAMLLCILLLAFTCAANASGIQIFYDGANHVYTGSVYKLYVNGNEIKSAMEPIIFNDHALVPVREVFEELGAEVDYTTESRCVEIQYDKSYIRLYINDNCAYVNGKLQEIPDNVVPKLINKPGGLTKTMVPVRFISETVGMKVDFDGDNGAIYINSNPNVTAKPMPSVAPTQAPTPKPTASPAPEKINITKLENKMLSDTSMKVTVTCSGSVEGKYSYFTLKSPERVVIDFPGMDFVGGAETIETKGKGIKAIRTGVDSERTRIVIDVENLKDYKVEKNASNVVEITVKVSGETAQSADKTSSADTSLYESVGAAAAKYAKGITKADSKDSKKVIMLDAGHGGTDPGAVGTLDGKTINEKDLTLSITYKVKAILEAKGYKTSMTRTGDTLPSLAERPEQANQEGCALFVSIHINSAADSDAYGTEVYWSEENNGKSYGITSEEFAENVLDGMIKYMKSYDRGVRMANWAVIRRSEMPAILAEVGFISNESELKKMCSDDYQNTIAAGISEGIINTVHSVTVP